MMRRLPGNNDLQSLLTMAAKMSGGIPDFAREAMEKHGVAPTVIDKAISEARALQDDADSWPQTFVAGPFETLPKWISELPQGVRLRPSGKGQCFALEADGQKAFLDLMKLFAKHNDQTAWQSIDVAGGVGGGEPRQDRILARMGLNITLDLDWMMEDVAAGRGAQYGLS